MQYLQFSIIVPIYNVKEYLNRCIESLLSQNRDDYEIILVDDGSTDGCSEMADLFAEKNPVISCIHKENGGLSSARNKGLEFAKGEYILFVDSDDWIENNALSVLADSIKGVKPDVVKFSYTRMPQGIKKVSTVAPGIYSKEDIHNVLLPLAIEKTNNFIFSAWSYLYKRELLKAKSLVFVSERLIGSEDYLFNTEVFFNANNMLVIDDALYFYNYRLGSLTGRYRPDLITQYQNLVKELCLFFKNSNAFDKYEKYIYKSYVWRCYSTCIANEMIITKDHSFWKGLYNCKRLFSSRQFRKAIKRVDYSNEPRMIQLRYKLMKANIIFPLVYIQYKSTKRIQKEKCIYG
ncbi:glycosyltransferase family 2 protein [Oribacterium sp. P6A1]|uniref:glycosyltransferase family 2 protein n=1 Tax=Oribacterium sp. P6A1 TaxID=1410612 RepID=UPI000568A5E5|nr:glycosyltransferase [Oribacterium sp. P6A1]